MKRLAVFLLDSVERLLVERLIREGGLPTLARLRASGAIDLEIPIPFNSERPWTEFATGRSASTLGYWSTVTFDPRTYEVFAQGAKNVPPFWDREDLRSIVLDVPHAILATSKTCTQVIGWGAHDPQYTRCSEPAGLLTALEAQHGQHPAVALEFLGHWNDEAYAHRVTDATLEGCDRRVRIVRDLLKRRPDWQLLLIGISDAHQAGHTFLHGIEPSPLSGLPSALVAGVCLRRIYERIDTSLEAMIRMLPPETHVIVASNKGMEVDRASPFASVLLPELLHRAHFGRPRFVSPDARRWETSGCRPIVLSPGEWDSSYFQLSGRRAVTAGAIRALRSVRRRGAPDPAHPTAEESPRPFRSEVASWNLACRYRDEWPRVSAFAIPAFSHGQIRFNVEGREAHGILRAQARAVWGRHLAGLLSEARDVRSGEPILRAVHETSVEDGAPADLHVELSGPVDAVRHPRFGLIGPFPFGRSGAHSSRGFVYGLAGIGPRPALDVVPTILNLLDLSTNEVEGRSLI